MQVYNDYIKKSHSANGMAFWLLPQLKKYLINSDYCFHLHCYGH